MSQDLLVANTTAVNDAGEPTYGATTTFKGRVIDKLIWAKGEQGEKLLASKQIVCPSSYDIRINSRIYLPGETTSADPGWPIAGLALRVGENSSSDHWKFWLGGVGGDGAAG